MPKTRTFSFLYPDGKPVRKDPFAGFTGIPMTPPAPMSQGAPNLPQLPGGGDLFSALQRMKMGR